MALHFQSCEDAIFEGLEAEGPLLGLPTLFIVGNPPVKLIVAALDSLASKNNGVIGLYLGAGGLLNKVLSLNALAAVLNTTKVVSLHRVAIECFHTFMIENSAAYNKVITSNVAPKYLRYLDWIVPVVWQRYELTDVQKSLLTFVDSMIKSPHSFRVFLKVYTESALFITPFTSCFFADFDNNAKEYQHDKLVWSSKEPKNDA